MEFFLAHAGGGGVGEGDAGVGDEGFELVGDVLVEGVPDFLGKEVVGGDGVGGESPLPIGRAVVGCPSGVVVVVGYIGTGRGSLPVRDGIRLPQSFSPGTFKRGFYGVVEQVKKVESGEGFHFVNRYKVVAHIIVFLCMLRDNKSDYAQLIVVTDFRCNFKKGMWNGNPCREAMDGFPVNGAGDYPYIRKASGPTSGDFLFQKAPDTPVKIRILRNDIGH